VFGLIVFQLGKLVIFFPSIVTKGNNTMSNRHQDGSAGDANYGVIGTNYRRYRQPDPHIASFILEALGDARTVLNVGAGAGSYEPVDRSVTAVEPSPMIRSTPAWRHSPCINGKTSRRA
jgi:hypothetical protein